MRKLDKAAVLVFLGTLVVCGLLLVTRGVRARQVRLNVRDLPEHGLHFISPVDAQYPNELAKFGFGRDFKQTRLLEATKPYSVILSNNSQREVIAYRVRWDMVRPDGTIKTHVTTYGEPDRLMGKGPHSDTEGLTIARSGSRYISVVTTRGPAQTSGIGTSASGNGATQTSGIGMGGSGGRDPVEASQTAQLASEKNETALIEMFSSELGRADTLTVTLDAAVFDDGTFAGPDSFGYFEQLQSLIRAKRELLQIALSGTQQGRPLGELFNDFEASAQNDSGNIAPQSRTAAEYYAFYKKQFAREILRIREATGDDKKALWRVTKPLDYRWTNLHRP